jgi:dTDP-4-amino-4,6-dideoxygalactose transaminase
MSLIPMTDLASQHQVVAAEVAEGWRDVLGESAFVGGQQVGQFEQEYARFLGVGHCVGLANGTDALEVALRALGVGPGDECILPANTFVATAEAVWRAGAEPVLADCVNDTYLIDPDSVAAAITGRTKAIIPVHLYGQAAPVELLAPLASRAGAWIVEDAAQAHGARRHGRSAGALGDVAATSFYPGKNLGAYGDAGATLTSSDDLAERMRMIASHGAARKYEHQVRGLNSRLDSMQAVVLSAKLRRLTAWNAARQAAAARYDVMLAGLEEVARPQVLAGDEHVWHLYVVRVPDRDRVLGQLHAAGISAGIHYPRPVHLTDAFADLGYRPGSFPVAELAAGQLLSLPLFPEITPAQQERVTSVLYKALRQ